MVLSLWSTLPVNQAHRHTHELGDNETAVAGNRTVLLRPMGSQGGVPLREVRPRMQEISDELRNYTALGPPPNGSSTCLINIRYRVLQLTGNSWIASLAAKTSVQGKRLVT